MSIKLMNVKAIVIAVISCGLAVACRYQWPWLSLGLMLAIAAVIAVSLDLYWRSNNGKRQWFQSAWGGNVLHMPLWLLAAVWLGLGAYQTYVRPIPALSKASTAMTWNSSAEQNQAQKPAADAKHAKH
jgi:hypothetical protein